MVGACAANPGLIPGKRVELEFEILDEGPYKGRKIWSRLIIDPASDQKERGKMSVEAIVSKDRQSIVDLMFKRLKLSPEEIQSAGFAAFTGRVAKIMVGQYVSGGKTRNDLKFYVDVDNGAAPVKPTTVRPVVTSDEDSAPF
jgi:hypothetical protein